MEYSLEILQAKTHDIINELEKSKELHSMALTLAEQVLGLSKNFKLTFSSFIDVPNSSIDIIRMIFSYLDSINIAVVITKTCSTYPKMINVSATKNGYGINNFRISTNDVSEVVDKIMKCTENKNE